MSQVCNIFKAANSYFSNEKVLNKTSDHLVSGGIAGVATLTTTLLGIYGRGKLRFLQSALPVAIVGYGANIGARLTAHKSSPIGYKNTVAQHVINPLTRGVVFGALLASAIGAIGGRTRLLALAATAAVAMAQAVEPKHGETVAVKALSCLNYPLAIG